MREIVYEETEKGVFTPKQTRAEKIRANKIKRELESHKMTSPVSELKRTKAKRSSKISEEPIREFVYIDTADEKPIFLERIAPYGMAIMAFILFIPDLINEIYKLFK